MPLPKRNFSSKMILSKFGKCGSTKLRFYCFCKVCENYRLGATGGASPSPTKAMKCCAGFAECKAKNAHRFSPYEKWEMSVQKLHN